MRAKGQERRRAWGPAAVCGVAVFVLAMAEVAAASDDGWTIPETAHTESNPMAGNAEAATKGRHVFKERCQRCHGAEGKGHGSEAGPAGPPDLTRLDRSQHPDGVIFYKVWNGHAPTGARKGRMPAFKSQLARDDVWRVVEFVKTLATAAP